MPLTYDPTSSDFTVDVEIDGESYIVTAFNDSGATPVGPDFSQSNGGYRGARREKGPREASMTIEVSYAGQPKPKQFTSFEYESKDWALFQVAKAKSSTSPSALTLTLRCENIPGTVESVTVTNGGSSYETPPTVTFTGGGGTGAAGTAVLTADAVTSVTITNAGSGYTTAPTVGFTGGGGASAAGTAVIVDPDE